MLGRSCRELDLRELHDRDRQALTCPRFSTASKWSPGLKIRVFQVFAHAIGGTPRSVRVSELFGCLIVKGAVRALGVVFDAPGFDRRARVLHVHEPVLVQALVAKPPVEALDVAVVDGLARWMKASRTLRLYAHASSTWPSNSGPWSTVIDEGTHADRAGARAPRRHGCPERGIDLDRQALAREVIHDRERSQLPAVDQASAT